MTARAVLCIFFVASLRIGIASVVETHDEACSGTGDPPIKRKALCYSGAGYGQAVTMKVDTFDPTTSMGTVLVTGTGMSATHKKCRKKFGKLYQEMNVEELEHCLPRTVKPGRMQYCSDQDHLLLHAQVGPMLLEIRLKPAACPSSLLEQEMATDNGLLSHSAWIWDAETCTGNQDPPTAGPYCYTGSKLGEVVTIKVGSFDSKSSLGSVQVSGSGLAKIKCERGFSKVQQLIAVDKLDECLPKTVKPNGMKFCSDQNQVLLDANVGIIPVQLVLIPAPCPTIFLEESAKAGSLIEGAWPWASTECTGDADPPNAEHSPICYSGTKMGEVVTIKVNSFKTPTKEGSVLVTGSGLAKVKCERNFLKSQQMISVTKLDECLPKTVKPSGLKYCSDQNRVILDANVALFNVEMVLDAAECPAFFLEQSATSSKTHMVQGEIFSSGIQRMVRSE